MDECAARVQKDMEDAEANAYKEYFEWCDDAAFGRSTALGRKASKEKLEAKIGQVMYPLALPKLKILPESISAADKELGEAIALREKEEAGCLD